MKFQVELRVRHLLYYCVWLIAVYAELDAAGQFDRMNLDVDEDEHSIEMHLPFIAKIMEEYDLFI